jgi:hypothetical protein
MAKRSILNYTDFKLPSYGYSIYDIENMLLEQGRYMPQDVNLFYLGYLCCQGDYASIVVFLQTLEDEEKRIILNEKPYDFYEGTVLHVLLYWNYGNNAINIFDLLVEHGAEFTRDYYGELPWEQQGATWLCEWQVKETRDYLRRRYGEDADATLQEAQATLQEPQDLSSFVQDFSQVTI